MYETYFYVLCILSTTFYELGLNVHKKKDKEFSMVAGAYFLPNVDHQYFVRYMELSIHGEKNRAG